jgi:hypothetical protein
MRGAACPGGASPGRLVGPDTPGLRLGTHNGTDAVTLDIDRHKALEDKWT